MALQTLATTDAISGRMAGSATGVGNSLADDVTNEVLLLSPTDTPLLTSLKKRSAKAVYHEWLSDALLAASSVSAVAEGAAYSQATTAARTRWGNYCAIQNMVYVISNTMQAVSQFGLDKELSYQLVKAMKELKRGVEYNLFNGTSASGGSGTGRVRNFDGFNEIVCQVTGASSNSGDAASDSGISHLSNAATEATFNSVLQDIFEDGGNPTVCYVTPAVKKKFSQWTIGTRNWDSEDKKLTNVVSIYESDFGLVKMVIDRFMPTALSGGANKGVATCIVGDFSNAGIAYLRPFTTKTTEATLRDAIAGIVEVEYTLEFGEPRAYGCIKFISGSGA